MKYKHYTYDCTAHLHIIGIFLILFCTLFSFAAHFFVYVKIQSLICCFCWFRRMHMFLPHHITMANIFFNAKNESVLFHKLSGRKKFLRIFKYIFCTLYGFICYRVYLMLSYKNFIMIIKRQMHSRIASGDDVYDEKIL